MEEEEQKQQSGRQQWDQISSDEDLVIPYKSASKKDNSDIDIEKSEGEGLEIENNNKHQTQICKYFQQNKCQKGDECTFKHQEKQGGNKLRQHKKSDDSQSSNYKKKPCQNFQRGRCKYGQNCTYQHDQQNQQSQQNQQQRQPCNNFFNKGFCNYSQNCKYSHDPIHRQNQNNSQQNNYNMFNMGNQNRGNQQQKPCFNFIKGNCQNGNNCNYSHDPQIINQNNNNRLQLNSQLSDNSSQQQQRGQRNYNIQLKKNQSDNEKFKGQKFQKALCQNFSQNNFCSQGKRCKYRHPPMANILMEPQDFEYDVKKLQQLTTSDADQDEIQQLEYEIVPQESKLTNDDNLILIRHGLSLYNYVANKFTYQTGVSYKHEHAKKYQLDSNLIDSGLHIYGKMQSLNAQKIAGKINIHTIFVSPQLRTLETCYEIFKNHPKFMNREMKIIVLPYLTEILSKVQDIAGDTIGAVRKRFEDYGFDFKYLTNDKQKSELWQLHNILDNSLKEKLLKKMQQKKLSWQEVCLSQISEDFPKPIENYEQVFERANEAKKIIKKYITKNKIDPKKQKICIVSHHGFLRTFTSTCIDQYGKVQEGLSFNNCQVVSYKI